MIALLAAACAATDTTGAPAAADAPATAETQLAAWRAGIHRQLRDDWQGYAHYPKAEQKAGVEGGVTAAFVVDRSGRVVRFQLLGSTGNSELDQEILGFGSMLQTGTPGFKAPPAVRPDIRTFYFSDPIVFCFEPASCQQRQQALAATAKEAQRLHVQAWNEFQRGEYDQSILDDSKAIDLLPDPAFYEQRGWTRYVQGQFAAARADFTAVLDRFPEFTYADYELGQVEAAEGHYEQAVADFSKSLESMPTLRAYRSRAWAYLALDQGDPALQDYAAAIALAPNDSSNYNARAWAYHRLARDAEGLADADRAIALNPRSAEAYDTRAHLYESLGRRAEALADYKAALSINPAHTASQDGLRRVGGGDAPSTR